MLLPRIRRAMRVLPATGTVVLPSHALTAAHPGAAHLYICPATKFRQREAHYARYTFIQGDFFSNRTGKSVKSALKVCHFCSVEFAWCTAT